LKKTLFIIAISIIAIGAVFTVYSYHFPARPVAQKNIIDPSADSSASSGQYPED